MKRRVQQHFGLVLLLIATSLLTIQALWFRETPDAADQFAQQVNLALRQTADGLLRLEKDSTSRIKPVRQTADDTWMISVEQNFNYDSLPDLLHRAFLLQNIKSDYNVTVLDCYKKELMLGYHSETYLSGEEVPCGGRERVAGCYELAVTFLGQSTQVRWQAGIWLFISLGIFVVYHWYNVLKKNRLGKKLKKKSAVEIPAPSMTLVEDKLQYFQFGQSKLDVSNQKLWVQHIQKDLTYREAKLLQFFCSHQNQLLERDQILKAVWEDEGVLVGRSVDVFVSRLRKLLKEDETIKIVNMYSVGYRFEVAGG